MTYRMPAEAFPPGDFLREELEIRGWTQTEFAQIIGRPLRLVNEIIAGKRGITPETAMDLAAAFGTSAQYWLNLESSYQLFKASPAGERNARNNRINKEARLREKYPVRELIKRNWIESSENFDVLESRVFDFYGVSSIDEEPRLLHAAKKNYTDSFSQNQLAWLFRVKKIACGFDTPKYSASKLRDAVYKLEMLTAEPEEIRHVPRILSECGVKFLIVEPLPSSRIDGVCFWVNENKTPVISLTLLHDRIDNFWFVLRHEIEHVLRGDGKQQPIIDEAGSGGGLTSAADSKSEDIANAAAEEFCVPSDEITGFIDRVDPMYSEKKIIGFSRRIARHPGLVIGQIQHRTGRYELLRRHLVKVREFIIHSAITDGYGYVGPISTEDV